MLFLVDVISIGSEEIMINQMSKPWSPAVTSASCLRLQSRTIAEDDQASSGASMTDAFFLVSPSDIFWRY